MTSSNQPLDGSDPTPPVPDPATLNIPATPATPAVDPTPRPDLDTIFSIGEPAPAPQPAAALPYPDPADPVPAPAAPVAGPGTGQTLTTSPSEPRIRTIVWGFIVLAVGVAVLASAAGLHLDPTMVSVAILALAGATLIIGSLATGARRRRRNTYRN